MKSGKLRHVITLQRATVAPNAAGTPVETWAATGAYRAELVSDATTEGQRGAGGATETGAILFRVRYVAGILLSDRVLWRGLPLNIRLIELTGNAPDWIVLTCQAGS